MVLINSNFIVLIDSEFMFLTNSDFIILTNSDLIVLPNSAKISYRRWLTEEQRMATARPPLSFSKTICQKSPTSKPCRLVQTLKSKRFMIEAYKNNYKYSEILSL